MMLRLITFSHRSDNVFDDGRILRKGKGSLRIAKSSISSVSSTMPWRSWFCCLWNWICFSLVCLARMSFCFFCSLRTCFVLFELNKSILACFLARASLSFNIFCFFCSFNRFSLRVLRLASSTLGLFDTGNGFASSSSSDDDYSDGSYEKPRSKKHLQRKRIRKDKKKVKTLEDTF